MSVTTIIRWLVFIPLSIISFCLILAFMFFLNSLGSSGRIETETSMDILNEILSFGFPIAFASFFGMSAGIVLAPSRRVGFFILLVIAFIFGTLLTYFEFINSTSRIPLYLQISEAIGFFVGLMIISVIVYKTGLIKKNPATLKANNYSKSL